MLECPECQYPLITTIINESRSQECVNKSCINFMKNVVPKDDATKLYEELRRTENEIGLLDGKKLELMEQAAQIMDKLAVLGEEVY